MIGLRSTRPLARRFTASRWFPAVESDAPNSLAIDTGGFVARNTNNFAQVVAQIAREAGDYYVLGYYSKNPDPTRRMRNLEVKVKRSGLDVWSRKYYALKPLPAPTTPQ